MFTGLIEDVGTIVEVARVAASARLTVATRLPYDDLAPGASVAVDGACLTAVERGADRFQADVSVETLSRTTLGDRRSGERVNLERPLALGGRLGGHLVLGHIDGVGRIVSRSSAGNGERFVVELPEALLPLVVEKGSIALDGISLTVNELLGGCKIGLLLIPESLRKTTWSDRRAGDRVNVEADVLGKHVARLLEARAAGIESGRPPPGLVGPGGGRGGAGGIGGAQAQRGRAPDGPPDRTTA